MKGMSIRWQELQDATTLPEILPCEEV